MSPSSSVTATRLAQSFSKKRIDVTFNIVDGNFGTTGADQLTVTGLRCQVDVTNAGMVVGSLLSLRIEGMRIEDMNRLSVLAVLPDPSHPAVMRRSQNTVTVQAGTDTMMSTVFIGVVSEAFVDFNGAPNIAFQVSAASTAAIAVDKPAPSSYSGAANAATILSDIAANCGLKFQNHGVNFVLHNWYGHGSSREQINAVVEAFGGAWFIDGQTLKVWGANLQADTSRTVPVVSAETGLIGYPAYNQAGVSFTCLYRPELEYQGLVNLKSNYAPAGWVNNQNQQFAVAVPSDGLWQIFHVSHELDSETPDGRWFTRVDATLRGNQANLVTDAS